MGFAEILLSNDERPLEKLKWRRGWLQEDERPPPWRRAAKDFGSCLARLLSA